MVQRLLRTAILTTLLELPFFWFGLKNWRKEARGILLLNVILINLFTNLVLNIWSVVLVWLRGYPLAPISPETIILELGVVAVETAMYFYATRAYEYKLCKLTMLTFLANATSYGVGLLLYFL